MEKYTSRKAKSLKGDNVGEYMSNEFRNFRASKGIRWELIAPHNPQHNGVAERKKRIIMGAAQAMFSILQLVVCI